MTAVQPVRQPARRKLHDRAGKYGDRDHCGDRSLVEADLGGEHGAERAIGAVGDADQENAYAGDRRVSKQSLEIQPRAFQRLW